MNLIERIQQGLTNNLGKWVHSHIIYTKMQKEGYTTEAIKRALDSVTGEPPYAVMKVESTDHRTLGHMHVNRGGYYYARHPMTEEELERLRIADEEWEKI